MTGRSGRLRVLSQSVADFHALRDSWGSVRGGWRGAWRDAAQLLAHRRLLVQTTAETPTGTHIVLRTRLRLSGDTQTDILRGWLRVTSAEVVEHTAQTHFQSVAVAAGGWAAVMGLQRLLTRLTFLAGSLFSLFSAVSACRSLLHTPLAQVLQVALTEGGLWLGFALMLLGVPARWILQRRLRAIFRRGLTPSAG